MREILFRGKLRDLAHEQFPNDCPSREMKWIYGTGIYNDGTNTWLILENPDYKPACNLKIKIVDPATVGQFIGLTDKNGKKIFEGDILQDKHKQKYFVSYSDNISSFITQPLQNRSHALSTPCLNVGTMRYYEIFGNIHDNPELPESGEKE